MKQQTVTALRPHADDGYEVEFQVSLQPADGRESVLLGKTNFGLLAVRVSRSLSVHFGGGKLTSSEGGQNEAQIFGSRARWVDYSGPVAAGRGPRRRAVTEGITYLDHPANPGYPSHWHVREDGWMGAAACLAAPQLTTRQQPLRLRYLLHAHAGPADNKRSAAVHAAFSQSPPMELLSGRQLGVKHRSHVLRRPS